MGINWSGNGKVFSNDEDVGVKMIALAAPGILPHTALTHPCATQWQAVLMTVLCVWVGASGVVRAADMEGLYETEVRVFSQSATERQEALRTALGEILVKVTSQRTAPAAPGLAGAFKRVDQMVQQYRYRPLAESRLLPLPAAPVAPARAAVRKPGGVSPPPPVVSPSPVVREQALWVNFDSAVVNKMLRQAGLPLWGRTRPAMLVVLAVEEPSNRYILLADSGAEAQTIFETRAWWRGVPIVLPQRAEAEGGLRFLEVWNNSQEAVLRVAAHERADAALVGRATHQKTGWQVRWTLFQPREQPMQWESAGDANSMRSTLEAGIDGAADVLGKRFAQLLSDKAGNIVLITVTDIVTLDHYAKVMDYFKSLDEVADVDVRQMHANSVTFRIAARSATETLVRTIALSKKLSPVVSTVIADPLAADAPQGSNESAEIEVPAPTSAATELKYQLLQ